MTDDRFFPCNGREAEILPESDILQLWRKGHDYDHHTETPQRHNPHRQEHRKDESCGPNQS